MLTFLDFFAGVGGFRRGMEMAGHKCLGHCEWDKFANVSYAAIHDIREDEWFESDIRNARADKLPNADVWCFGFPCQDVSIAGKQKGIVQGTRSGLFYAVTDILRETEEDKKPRLLFVENVKNLLSINSGWDFYKCLLELDAVGYDAEWQLLNTKNFGLPHNRERVFVIGHLRGRSRREVFPITETNGNIGVSIKRLAHSRYYRRVLQTYSGDSSIEALDTMQGGNRQPCVAIKEATKKGYAIAEIGDSINLEQPNSKTRRGRVGKCIANTLTCSCNQGTLDGLRIRKLTPKECWRLQGWNDVDFYKAKKALNDIFHKGADKSDSQLYKQAGNGVSVPVIYEIAKRLELI